MLALMWIRVIFAAIFILVGLAIIVMAVIGVYRFNYVMNRMHVAAACDTLGLLLLTIGFIILNGFRASSLKLLVIVVFFWMANPVVSHLISKLEVTTNEHIDEECEVMNS